MTLTEKVRAAEISSTGKRCTYAKTGQTYTYGENPYIDQFIAAREAQRLFPGEFGPYDLSPVAFED